MDDLRERANRAFPFLLFIFTLASLFSMTTAYHPFGWYGKSTKSYDKTDNMDAYKKGKPTDSSNEGTATDDVKAEVELLWRSVLTLGVGASSLFIILAKRFGPGEKHWAFAALGTLLGYWLR